MIHLSPSCPYARKFRLRGSFPESFVLPDHLTNTRALWHYDRCQECREFTAVKHGHNNASARFTRSSTRPDVVYVTTADACSCPGFAYRGSCRHLEETA